MVLASARTRTSVPRGVPVIFDWDDAFHLAYQAHGKVAVRRLLGQKFDRLLKGAAAVTCGNDLLRDHASRFCQRSDVRSFSSSGLER